MLIKKVEVYKILEFEYNSFNEAKSNLIRSIAHGLVDDFTISGFRVRGEDLKEVVDFIADNSEQIKQFIK